MIYSVQVEFNKEFLEIEDNIIRVGLLSKPVKGEANKELIKKRGFVTPLFLLALYT